MESTKASSLDLSIFPPSLDITIEVCELNIAITVVGAGYNKNSHCVDRKLMVVLSELSLWIKPVGMQESEQQFKRSLLL